MASERTITVGKGSIKWYTGSIRGLYYNHDQIVSTYKTLIQPNLRIKEGSTLLDIRRAVSDLVENLIIKGEVSTMLQWCNLVVALRETEIDRTEVVDGFYKLYRSIPPEGTSLERVTFYNVAYHMNHHCRQLYHCCFVQVAFPTLNSKRYMNISWATGEWKDNENYFLDRVDLLKEEKKKDHSYYKR